MTKVNQVKKSQTIKRVKREINFDLKCQILNILKKKRETNPKYTRSNLIKDIVPIIGYKMPPTTLSGILKNTSED